MGGDPHGKVDSELYSPKEAVLLVLWHPEHIKLLECRCLEAKMMKTDHPYQGKEG